MRRRWHPLTIGTVAAIAALAAALAAGAIVRAVEGDPPRAPQPELDLTFEAGDDRTSADDLIGGDVEGTAPPDSRFTLLDGGSMAFSDLRGTPVVVNFFASWCAPCVKEMPDFEAVHQELGERVAFVGVDVRDSVAAAQELVDRTGVTYTIGRDPSGDLFRRFSALNMPSTFFISAEGIVVGSHAGALDAAGLRSRIDDLLLP